MDHKKVVIMGHGGAGLAHAISETTSAIKEFEKAVCVISKTYELPDPCCQLFREKSKKNWKTRPFWEK